MQVACDIPLERSWRRIQLFFRPHLIEGLYIKVWGPKVVGVPTMGISGLPLGSPRTKWHLGHSSDIRNTRIFRRCSKRNIFKYFKIWKCEYVKYVNTMNKTLSKLSLSCAQTLLNHLEHRHTLLPSWTKRNILLRLVLELFLKEYKA
jgi:hypothetical protein